MKTRLERYLFASPLDVATTSADSLRRVASFPYCFESAIITQQLGDMEVREIRLNQQRPALDIIALALVPGGCWLIALAITEHSRTHGATYAVLVWDVATGGEEVAGPVAQYILNSDRTAGLAPEILEIQPAGADIVVFISSTAYLEEDVMYVAL